MADPQLFRTSSGELEPDWNSLPDVEGFLAIQEQKLGPKSLPVAVTLIRLADLYFIEEDYVRAEPLYWRALEIRRAILGNSHVDIASTLQSLGELFEVSGRADEAERFYLWAKTMKERVLGVPAATPEMYSVKREPSKPGDTMQFVYKPAVAEDPLVCRICKRTLPASRRCGYCVQEYKRNIKSTLSQDQKTSHSESLRLPTRLIFENNGTEFGLKPTVRIGRHASNELVLDKDDYVSNYHASITLFDDLFWLEDLASTNGTYLNGRRVIQKEMLHIEDVIKIGNTSLKVD
jgi:hypothetical protein